MITETLSAVAILGIAILFLNPGHLSMPQSMQSMLIVGIIISFLIFSAFLLKERGADERDTVHILTAGRISYLVGVGILIIGIILQALSHQIDPWLVVAICSMVFSKLVSRFYSHLKK